MHSGDTTGTSLWRREMLDEKCPELTALFEKHGVIAAYVFGSLARGQTPRRITPRTDLDLAVLFPTEWTREARARRAALLERDLISTLGRKDVDLVVANDAPLVLRRQITRHRDVIHGREAEERVGLDWRTLREYLDTKPLRRWHRSAMLRRVREGSFGVRPGSSP